jgi:polysaccharide pyruvyl transferase WcaK-like protein
LLESIGVGKPVNVTADVSFLMEPPEDGFADSVWHRARLDSLPRPVIATALRPWGSSDWVSEIAAGLDDAARRLGGSVVLLPFQRGVDDPLAASVADSLECAKEVVKFEATPLQLLALISRSDVLLGMRLHSLIFAVMSGVPCVAVSYDPKVDAFAEEATLPRAVSFGRVSSAAVSSAIVDCWNAKGEISHRLKASCESLRGRAQRNVRLALSAAAGGD